MSVAEQESMTWDVRIILRPTFRPVTSLAVPRAEISPEVLDTLQPTTFRNKVWLVDHTVHAANICTLQRWNDE